MNIIPIQPIQLGSATGMQVEVSYYTATFFTGGASARCHILDASFNVLYSWGGELTRDQYSAWPANDLFAVNTLCGTCPLGALTPLPAPVITSSAALAAPLGQPITFQVTASNQPASFAVDALPDGLVLDSVAGTISGMPTTAGTYTANLSVTNIQGSGTQALVITVA